MMRKRIAKSVGILSLSLFAFACSQTAPTVPTPHFIAWSQANRATLKQVCVLPFTDKVKVPGLANQVRQSFAGHLSVKRFADSELYDIDARLETIGKEWQTTSAQDLGKALGCHALVYGEVTRANRLYLALYSQLTLEGGIHVVDTETGQTLVKDTYATKFRSAGVPLSPLSIVPDAIKNLSNLSDVQMVRAVDDLSRNLAAKVPDLPSVPIYQATTSAPSAPSVVEHPETPPAPLSAPYLTGKKKLPPAKTVAQLESSAFDVPPTSTSSDEKKTRDVSINAVAATSVSLHDEDYRLQIAALRTSAEAQRVIRLLRSKGYEPIVVQSVDTKPIWHRIVLGPFPSIHSAQAIGTQIHKTLHFSPVVINLPKR